MIRKLASQTMIYGLSTIIPKVINYLLTPYLTYIALTESDFGVIGYFYAIIPFAFSILLLGMESGFFRFVGKEASEESRKKVFSTVWSTSVLLALLFFAIVILFRSHIYKLIDGDYHISIISSVATIILIDVISAIPFAQLRESNKAMRFTVIKGLSVVINVMLVVFFYSLLPELKDNHLFSWMWVDNYGAGYFFVANIVSSFVALLMVLKSTKYIKLSIDPKLLKSVLIFSVPLFIGGLAGTANEFLDRFFIKELLPKDIADDELGIYVATIKLTAIMVIFTQMYRYAAEPLFLSKLKGEEFKDSNAIVTRLYFVVTVGIFLFITLFLDVFQYIIAPKFRGALDIVPFLLISSALIGLQLNLTFWYKYKQKTHFAIVITTIGLITSVVLNIVLIPKLAVMGAALAKMCGAMAMVIVSYYLNQKYYPINYGLRRFCEYFAIAVVIYFANELINIDNMLLLYTFRVTLLLIYAFYVIKREKILFLFKKNY